MGLLRYDALDLVPLQRDPFDFVIVPGFVDASQRAELERDFPRIAHPGSFPVGELSYGPAFDGLLDELRGPGLTAAVAAKLRMDLTSCPTVVTVRGRCHPRDGRVHTDAVWKVATMLLYLNGAWEAPGGRLRMLRSSDVNDVAAEVPPEWGTLIAFRRSDRSFHGHASFEGERRVVQLNWATEQRLIDREVARHRRSAWLKRWVPFATRAAY